MFPFIAFGLTVNVIPYLIVRLASRRVRVPVTKGTVRMLVGIAVFPITWIVLSIVFADDWWAVLFFVACPVAGFRPVGAGAGDAQLAHPHRLAGGERERRWFAENLRVHRADLVRGRQSVSTPRRGGPAGGGRASGRPAR
jgi:hypothetical protein